MKMTKTEIAEDTLPYERVRRHISRYKDNPAMVTALATFAIALPSMTAYTRTEPFERWRTLIEFIVSRNLMLRHGLTPDQASQTWTQLKNLLQAVPEFLISDTYDEDVEMLREEVWNHRGALATTLKSRLHQRQSMSSLERNLFEFTLGYVPVWLEAEDDEDSDTTPAVWAKSGLGHERVMDILCEIWTRDFNSIYGQSLAHETIRISNPISKPKPRKKTSRWIESSQDSQEFRIWIIGDMLVSSGLAFWSAYVSSSGRTALVELHMPKCLFARLEKVGSHLFNVPQNIRESIVGLADGRALVNRWASDS